MPKFMDEPTQCIVTHNHGKWPYVARCVKDIDHHDKHRDVYGNEWEDGELTPVE